MCTIWYRSINYGSYAPKRILNYFMNICWSYLGFKKSLQLLIQLESNVIILSFPANLAHGKDEFLEATGIDGFRIVGKRGKVWTRGKEDG